MRKPHQQLFDSFEESKLWCHLEHEYDILGKLGRGSYGKVIKARCKVTGKVVAIKLVENIFDGAQISRNVVREL